jgi:3-hydroxyisobutyrate dehydrogenase-like beta-hydroxyacid dehydrogenase
MRGTRIIEENYTPSFQLETARKDVRLMLESAAGQPTPVLSAVATRMDDLIARGLGGQDMAVMAKREV